MATPLHFGPVLVLLGLAGCSGSAAETSGPVDPNAVEALRAHWHALQRRDWDAAYRGLHPELKKAGITPKRFADLQAKRRETPGFPNDITITGSEKAGDDAVVSFDLIVSLPGGGEQGSASHRRKATLRKSGNVWGLMTHDLLAIGP
jgi:hypothetical protein